MGVTVRAGDLPAHSFPFQQGETRAGNKGDLSVPRWPHHMEGAMPRQTRPPGGPRLLPVVVHAAVAGSPQASHSRGCDAGGLKVPPSAMDKDTLDHSPGHMLSITGLPQHLTTLGRHGKHRCPAQGDL